MNIDPAMVALLAPLWAMVGDVLRRVARMERRASRLDERLGVVEAKVGVHLRLTGHRRRRDDQTEGDA